MLCDIPKLNPVVLWTVGLITLMLRACRPIDINFDLLAYISSFINAASKAILILSSREIIQRHCDDSNIIIFIYY
jgi:hypothetical protein